jgi:hypothetical protein
VRVLSSPSYGAAVQRPADLIEPLRSFCASGDHVFWSDSVSIREKRLFNLAFVRGHAQITDVSLLGLAKKMSGRLATLDRTVPLSAVVGARREHLTVISVVNE